METDRILDRLRYHDDTLPNAEVAETRRRQARFIPHLLQECRYQIAKLRKLEAPCPCGSGMKYKKCCVK